MIFIIFSFNNIYNIVKGEGDNPVKYFIYKRHEECTIHNSTSCGCKLYLTQEEFSTNIRRSLDFYRICSTILEIVDGKIKYINFNSKIEFVKYSSSTSSKLIQ